MSKTDKVMSILLISSVFSCLRRVLFPCSRADAICSLKVFRIKTMARTFRMQPKMLTEIKQTPSTMKVNKPVVGGADSNPRDNKSRSLMEFRSVEVLFLRAERPDFKVIK